MKLSLLGLTVLFSLNAHAIVRGIKCERDARPVDGVYVSVEILKNQSDKFDVYYQIVTPGHGSPATSSRVLIARNLYCEFGSTRLLLGECLKSSSEEGELTNSGLTLKQIHETTIEGKLSKYHLTVYSPQLYNNHEKPGYPYTETQGRVEFEFGVTGNSPNLGHCVAL